MDFVSMQVFFEKPFWVGRIERISEQKLTVCKIMFGAEPKDGEIYEFVLKKYNNLRFSPSIETTVNEIYKNPKRMKREVRKQLAQVGMGTKSQKALKLQWENTKWSTGRS